MQNPAAARQAFDTARAAYLARDFAAAEAACRGALELAPGESRIHLLLGEVLLGAGRRAEALAAYARAAELFPGLGLPFTRLATLRLRQRYAPVPPRRADPTRPRLQMTTLGRRGRFGNQLLQYAYARIYADRHALELEVPDWIGRDLYGLDDPLPRTKLEPIDESQADFGAILRGVSPVALAGRDLSGYFAWDTRGWGEAAGEFRRLFRLRPALGEPLEAEFQRLTADTGTRVAIHLRRGDFGQGRFWVAPVAWYLDWLQTLWPRLDRPCLFLATDAPELEAAFAPFRPLLARDFRVEYPGAQFLVDHFVLSRAEHLAISNSSFSFSAALLNERLVGAVRPDPDARRLAPFAPWQAPVLLDATRVPEALGPGERTVLARMLPRAAAVVHVGRVCSPWTNEVRATLQRLRVYEIDAATPLDELRRTLPLRHVPHLRLESARDLGRVLDGAGESLRHARIDCIEFTTKADQGVGREIARVLPLGYRLYAVDAEGLREVADGRIHRPGTHLLLHERLVAARPQAGAPLIDIAAEARRHGVALAGRGVLHVGAHEGQEAPLYERLGLAPIVLVEANPVVYARLAQAMASRPAVRTVQRAVSDRAGTVTLHLASFDQSSSLLPLAQHLEVYPGISPAGEVSVAATPLDALVAELGLQPDAFVLLHIDVQGAELLVLRGAEAVLAAVSLVSIEVNFAELYRGGAEIEAIDDWLGARGFTRVALSSAYHPSWGDALYLRAPPSPRVG